MNPNDKYKTVCEWAWAYRKMGWNAVPLYNYTKIPSGIEIFNADFGWLPGWKELEGRQATEEEFVRWFGTKEQPPSKMPTGVGLITGAISKIVVVDEDSYKGDGMKFEFTSPFRAQTARGGRHHFFKYVEPIKTSGFRKGVNIEIKSDGGFLVLPPSEVFIDKTRAKYSWEAVCKLDSLPTITEKQLSRYRSGDWERVGGGGTSLRELVGVERGYQHNAMRTLVLKMFYKFPKSDWDIAERYVRSEFSHYKPPVPERNIQSMIRDCQAYVLKNGGPPSEEDIPSKKVIGPPRSIGAVSGERLAEKELERDAPKTGYPDLDRIVKGFIPGHLYTFTGDTNVGKTTMAMNFAERVVKQGKRVLYFALEPENTVVDYLASIRTGKMFDDLTKEDLTFDDPNLHVYGKEEIATVDDMLEAVRNAETRYDLIIVDHIGYFVRDKNNTNQEQSNVIKQLVGLAKEKKSAVMVIAHLRKQPAQRSKKGNVYIPTMDDISGSGAFKQDSTEVFILLRMPNNTHPNDRTLSNEGKLFVDKTKAGPNGVIDVYFSDRKAGIMTIDEIMNSPMLTQHEKLTMAGFPDVKKPVTNETEDDDDEDEKWD